MLLRICSKYFDFDDSINDFTWVIYSINIIKMKRFSFKVLINLGILYEKRITLDTLFSAYINNFWQVLWYQRLTKRKYKSGSLIMTKTLLI